MRHKVPFISNLQQMLPWCPGRQGNFCCRLDLKFQNSFSAACIRGLHWWVVYHRATCYHPICYWVQHRLLHSPTLVAVVWKFLPSKLCKETVKQSTSSRPTNNTLGPPWIGINISIVLLIPWCCSFRRVQGRTGSSLKQNHLLIDTLWRRQNGRHFPD